MVCIGQFCMLIIIEARNKSCSVTVYDHFLCPIALHFLEFVNIFKKNTDLFNSLGSTTERGKAERDSLVHLPNCGDSQG